MRLLIALTLLVTQAIAHPGVGIVKDSKGNVFYTDLTHVWKIDTQGKKSIAVKNVHTHELFMDESDNLFGEHLWYNGETANTWGYYVWKLSATGSLHKVIPSTTGFREDYSFVRDHMGRMYHADRANTCQHLERINPDKSVTKLGDNCLTNIRWMTAASNGSIYLIDGPDLKKVDPAGHVSTLAMELPEAKLSQFFVNKDHYLGGLAVDAAQNIYVADFSGRNVKKISKDGKVTVVAETGIPWSPSGLLVEANGDLWILEYSITNEARVEKIHKGEERRETF